jgi:hypothetical protein
MPLSTRVSGSWKNISTISVKVNGAWKTCRQVYVRQSGVWKKCLQNTSTATVNGPSLGLGNGVTVSGVTVGTTVTLTGTYYPPNGTATLHVVYTNCSKNADWKEHNNVQSANFSFSVTANKSTISIEMGTVRDGMHWESTGSLSNCKISYTTTGYFD